MTLAVWQLMDVVKQTVGVDLWLSQSFSIYLADALQFLRLIYDLIFVFCFYFETNSGHS